MKKRLFDKLRSQAGESLAETLIAVLISAFAVLMLQNAVSGAMNTVNGSKKAMNNYYIVNNAMTQRLTKTDSEFSNEETRRAGIALGDDFSGEFTVTIIGDGNAYLGTSNDGKIDATYYKNGQLNAVFKGKDGKAQVKPVVAYTYTHKKKTGS